ncbi:MAG TPA: response regulator transcription factor [Flavobacterium sp.]|jgi:DNA-binding response OmpR family regulator
MPEPIRLILAEDEPALAGIIKETLEIKNFEVTLCSNGDEALYEFNRRKPDIVVLDIMMPRKDGISVAKDIRKLDKNIPIIFLTAKSQVADLVEGFEAGGNDYLKKPFSMQELIVRILALLGRTLKEKSGEDILIGKYSFNPMKQTLMLEGKKIVLTHRESAVLEMLAMNRNEVLDRSLILKTIWGDDDFFSGRSMDVFITKLRKKLAIDSNIHIINVRGQGYKLSW